MNDLLYEMARISPLQPGCVEENHLMLYPSLHGAATDVAKRLQADFGIKPGDRVAILADPQWRWIPLLFAIFRCRAIAVPLNLRLPPQSLRERLRLVSPRVLVLDDTHAGMFPEIASARLESLCRDTLHHHQGVAFDQELDEPATIVFSSGSLGHPRALLHSFGNHYFSALGAQRHFPMTVGDRWLLSLPLYHVGGLAILFRCVIAGATVVIPDEEGELADHLLLQGITHVSLVPTQLQRLLEHPHAAQIAKKLKRVVLGGAPISPALVARALALGFPVSRSYGMTETASMVSAVARTALLESQINRDGVTLQYRELRLTEDNEIQVRGPVVCLGEWVDGNIRPLVKEDGWLSTGDRGEFQDGELKVLGRIDTMFISGGENIHPEEIERVLMDISGASMVVVTPQTDPEFGQRPCAWLDLSEAEWKIDEWTRQLRERLPGYMIPAAWKPLPAANTGLKPDRKSLGSS